MLESSELPNYNRQQDCSCPIMDPYRNFIEQILHEDKTAPVQQRHTAARIYERLVDEHGYTGGESTVRHYVRKLKAPVPECFLKLEANPGEQVQVDFGHAEVNIGGERVRICLFCMRIKYSSVPFVVAFPTERLEAFLEGHVRAFNYFGGIPREGLLNISVRQSRLVNE